VLLAGAVASPVAAVLFDDPVELAPEAPVDAVETAVVDVVWAAAFSALVSVGGVISGVLFGTASETLLPPPHAVSVTLARTTSIAGRAAR